jgi:phytol kinase
VVLALNALYDNWTRAAPHTDELLLILVLINGLGDGLAEPVGVRFGGKLFSRLPLIGKRLGKYRVRAWRHQGQCCSGQFTRSWEGSATVWLVSLMALLALNEAFTRWQWIVALIALPPLMALTEARAPRTWDSPFLFLVGGVLLALIMLLPV